MKKYIAVITSLLILAVSGVSDTTFGQSTGNKGSADASLRSSGNVNPSTLGMEMQIPFGSYSGRGMNLPISLSYSSKNWRIDQRGYTPMQLSNGCPAVVAAAFAESSAAGWTNSLQAPYIEYSDAYFNVDGTIGDIYTDCPDLNTDPYHQEPEPIYGVRAVTIHLQSGESHKLRMDDTIRNCRYTSTQCLAGWYYAVDGSNIKYYEDDSTNTHYLLLPDGSRYDFNTQRSTISGGLVNIRWATQIADRNGNLMTYHPPGSSENNITYPNGYWKDTLGKNIAVPFQLETPTTPANQSYSMPGTTGTYTLRWKQLKGATAAESALTTFSDSLNYPGDECVELVSGIPYLVSKSPALFASTGPTTGSTLIYGCQVFNPVVLAEIELPTGGIYKFTYNVYGELEKIYYPTGGSETYTYGFIPPLAVIDRRDHSVNGNRGVKKREVFATADAGTPIEWNYAAAVAEPQGYRVSVAAPDGTISERLLHIGDQVNATDPPTGTFGYDDALAGMPFEEKTYSSTGKLVTQKLTNWTKTSFDILISDGTNTSSIDNRGVLGDWNPRVVSEEIRSFDESGNGISQFMKIEYEGDLSQRETPLLIKKKTEYAYQVIATGGSNALPDPTPCEPTDDCPLPSPSPTPVATPTPASLTPLRSQETTYLINDANLSQTTRDAYKDRNMVGLATASVVKDGAGNIVARRDMFYDESAYPLINNGTATGWTDPQTTIRGNSTTSRVWDSTKGSYTSGNSYIATHAKFDNFGNLCEAIDAKGNSATTTFDATYYAFPTSVTSAVPNLTGHSNGSTTAFQTTTTFNTTTGLPTSSVDANGIETRIEYDPVMLRPLNTNTFYNNVQIGSQSETVYHDEPNNYWTKSRAKIDDTHWAESISYYDGLGRAYKSEQVNSQGNIFVEKEFDAQGRVSRVTNPYRAGETKQWTTNVYDESSRVKEVDLPDSSKVLTAYSVSVSGAVGITKQITDQAGRKRKGVSDALGRMIRVIEDPDGQNLSTDYTFDTLGNLHQTVQGEQSRYFLYDSLGRLLYAKQPEQNANANFSGSGYTDPLTSNNQWSVKYEYDDAGNITKTTDARNISIQGTYDNFNRLIKRDYSDATPDVSFYYDGTGLPSVPAFSRGKTTKVTSNVSENRYTSFDPLGRMLASEQRTPFDPLTETVASVAPKTFQYSYNLSGALTQEVYPSGRVVKNTVDENGELAQVQTKKNANFGYLTYAGGIHYNTAGAVDKMQLGNGRWETAAYNNRQQVTQIGLGTTSADQNLLKLEFGYSTTGNNDNNGAMLSQKITVPTEGSNAGFVDTQTYTYDSLNRIQSATEKDAGNNQTWKQTFQYDRYGNRRFDTTGGNTTTLGSSFVASAVNPTISTANNKISDNQGYTYDQNGNLTQDTNNLVTPNYVYDAESRQIAVKDSGSVEKGIYVYDGEGRRVKKIAAGDETIFVYDGAGQLAAEYSVQLSTAPQVSYLTADHLGSPRVVTNQTGAITSRKDYNAYGDETFTSQRTTGLHYTPQNQPREVRADYTGYQKDEESGLEYAQARFYNPGQGRFTSVDPLMASASIKDPQTFNRYTYGLNSPYKFTDPLGLISQQRYGACGQWCGLPGADGDSFEAWGRGQETTTQETTTQETTTQGSQPQSMPSGDGTIDAADITPTVGTYDSDTTTTGKTVYFMDGLDDNATAVAKTVEQNAVANVQNRDAAIKDSKAFVDSQSSNFLGPNNVGTVHSNGMVSVPGVNGATTGGSLTVPIVSGSATSGSQSTNNPGAASADKANQQRRIINEMSGPESQSRRNFIDKNTGKHWQVFTRNGNFLATLKVSASNLGEIYDNAVTKGLNAASEQLISIHTK